MTISLRSKKIFYAIHKYVCVITKLTLLEKWLHLLHFVFFIRKNCWNKSKSGGYFQKNFKIFGSLKTFFKKFWANIIVCILKRIMRYFWLQMNTFYTNFLCFNHLCFIIIKQNAKNFSFFLYNTFSLFYFIPLYYICQSGLIELWQKKWKKKIFTF